MLRVHAARVFKPCCWKNESSLLSFKSQQGYLAKKAMPSCSTITCCTQVSIWVADVLKLTEVRSGRTNSDLGPLPAQTKVLSNASILYYFIKATFECLKMVYMIVPIKMPNKSLAFERCLESSLTLTQRL